MKILLLEPHGDDALLSCFSLLKTNNDIDLLTFSERGSEGLISKFESITNHEFVNFPNIWYKDGKVILNTHDVHRRFLNKEPISSQYDTQLQDIYKDEWISDFMMIESKIAEYISHKEYDLVVCPSGITHPYHVLIRQVWSKIKGNIPTLYYADKYYIQNRYSKEMYEDLKSHLNCDKEINPGYVRLEVENKELVDILYEVYPSEGKLMRFYSDIILWYPCKYMYNSNDIIIERLVGDLNG